MSICMLGVDHNKASVDVRSLFSFTKKSAAAAMEQLYKKEGISGAIIISTCNRMELWLSVEDEWDGSLIEEICLLKMVDPTEFKEYFVLRTDHEAVDHLFHLTCGLKSKIVGEDQIITQVKDALSLARESYTTDNVLEVLFRMAVTAAKKVKTDVVFSRANVTAMDHAVAMLREHGYIIEGEKCMIIGNGEMGKLAAQTMVRAGADVTVTVRQYRSGIVQIPKGCARIHYGERMELFPKCKIVVSATASPNYTLTKELIDNVELAQPMILIDLAVPRDIEPSIGEIDGITLYDIDHFQTNTIGEHQKNAFQQAEFILQEKEAEFFDWYDGRDIISQIQDIKNDAVADFEPRVRKIIAKLPMEETDKQELQSSLDLAVAKVVNKMIFGLKDTLDKEQFIACVEGLEKLYENK